MTKRIKNAKAQYLPTRSYKESASFIISLTLNSTCARNFPFKNSSVSWDKRLDYENIYMSF